MRVTGDIWVDCGFEVHRKTCVNASSMTAPGWNATSQSLSLGSEWGRASTLFPLMFTARTRAGMNPLAQPNRCKHPKLETMIKFKGDYETIYRCLICNAVVSSREIDMPGGPT
jgi:hypothetical protein